MTNNEKRDRTVAVAGTLLVHGLLVFVLFLMAFRTPLPLPGEEGVEVNLGYDDEGFGNESFDDAEQAASSKQIDNEAIESEEEILTSDSDDTPFIESQQEESQKNETETNTEETNPETNQPDIIQKALFQGAQNGQNNGSEGITEPSGDQGNPNGLENVNHYDGHGGEGISYDLGGRGCKRLAKGEMEDMPDQGIVVVDIWVNPEGKVTRAVAGAKGTTVSNTDMQKLAEKYALASEFEPQKDALSEQHGTITYTFKHKIR